jgi:two-component system, NarL family, sensor histidine kinase BarA
VNVTIAPAPIEGDTRLEDLVDRTSLDELCSSVFALFGLPVRVVSADGTVYGQVSHEHEVCAFVATAPGPRAACRATRDAVRTESHDAAGAHPCFTGLQYRVDPFMYDARLYGKIVIGPFTNPAAHEPTPDGRTTLAVLDGGKFRDLVAKVPKAKMETVARIATHLKAALDLILFNAHKALLTSSAHLMSVREGFRELTEKSRSLEEANRKLIEADRMKTTFLATVSHELKTPLTSILGYSEMLSEGLAGSLSEQQADYVRTIHDRGAHLLSMITGLLDLSKLEIGALHLKRETGRIFELLGDVWTSLIPIANKKGVALLFDCTDVVMDVRYDSTRLEQVFTNIIENAIKFTPKGGTVRISNRVFEAVQAEEDSEVGFLVLAQKRKVLEIRVSDTGIGIAPEQREKVFDPFYQVDSSATREHGGTGLGLAIAKRILTAHGGDVVIEGNEELGLGKGATFVVTLPQAGLPGTSIPAFQLFDTHK